ncbi:endonuclease/exonuclease/phosphatase family protein [Medicago truncatula]|uniref:Endonuclease/exonuclease/phosphatase family protein n=1 Tax=Medicago truncatula TaxID=3880 RepID=A0A072U6W0_MEDTR|nr:endonuclease/exonuclease/phosphatase family protein [Medicago truncatula]
MKLVSWNIRGLGGVEKKREVRSLLKEKSLFIVCLQETKLQVCDDGICSSMWDLKLMAFSFRPSQGASGGLLNVWDLTEVDVWSTVSLKHVLVIHGRFLKSNEEFHLFNIYAPCDSQARRVLWESLSLRLGLLRGTHVCVCGDFNVVRSREEKRSASDHVGVSDGDHFNQFIDNNFLCDLPLSGKSFTWFKGDENWGPKPSRFLKCWSDTNVYAEFVNTKSKSFQVDGWGGYVLKEKFKLMKAALKEWYAEHTQNLSGKIVSLKQRLAVLDGKGEVEELTEAECDEMHAVTADIHSFSRMHTSISWQQSRYQWLSEGDANSKFFHYVFSSRWRRNTLSSVLVDGVEIEGLLPVRHAVFSHFESHFQSQICDRPSVENLKFRSLSVLEGEGLITLFSVDEVKVVVWDCDSFKSPGPDGVNFSFIKEFWLLLKDDIMRFVVEFHRNGKLTKGINSTFIALIPKVDSPRRLNEL